MDIEERKLLAQKPIVWKGDLEDDCTAEWAGLMLRAEWMQGDYWWWAVYEMERHELTIDDAISHTERFIGGEMSRAMVERVAKNYIATITSETTALFTIWDTFKISGRGLVLAGSIEDGWFASGDIIVFETESYLKVKEIIGFDRPRLSESVKWNTGLLLRCIDENEINELRMWKPNDVSAIIYKKPTRD